MAFQRLIIQGRLTRDPELFTTSAGMSITTFDVAVDGRPNAEGEKTVEFFRCKAFKARAEVVDKYFLKGDGILVEGRIQTESWADKETGQKKYRVVVLVDSIDFPPGKVDRDGEEEPETEQPQRAAKPAGKQAARKPAPPAQQGDAFDDDIPF